MLAGYKKQRHNAADFTEVHLLRLKILQLQYFIVKRECFAV